MKESLIDKNYELIKQHILSPESAPLNDEQSRLFDRVMSIAKVFDKNPVFHHAVKIHRAKYPEITLRTAYNDANIARKLFNDIHSFDYDFWQTWLINNIIDNIKRARLDGSPQALRVIAMEHANLIKALGQKPETTNDPRLNEKHEFYLVVDTGNETLKIDMALLQNLPKATLRELNNALLTAHEITDAEAEEIMKT